MPDIPVDVRTKDYVTDQGFAARSLRLFVTIEIGSVRPLCFLDNGAPFSFVSFDVAQKIPWTLLGTAFQGKAASMDWQGIPCSFGETNIDLLDPQGTIRVAGLRLVGKFAKVQHSLLRNHVILGMSFLVDNSIDFVSRNRSGSVSAVLSVP